MDFLNYTPHSINIIANATFNADIRKYVTSEASTSTITIPPSGELLNCVIDTVEIGNCDGFPIFNQEITACDVPPEGCNIIVSQLYIAGVRAMHPQLITSGRLYTIADPVYTHDGEGIRPCGCRGLTQVIR